MSEAGLRGFSIEDLIDCYRRGIFPMSDGRADNRVYLIDPPQRGVIPLDGFHVSRRLARTVRGDRFEIRIDTAFDATVEACAAPRKGHPETWISHPIQALCGRLFARGLAHSVEAWRAGRLVGGLYGVALGGAFFGESMFSIERDASKVALTHLAARLVVGRFTLLDAQFITDHLLTLGAVEITRAEYRRRLAIAMAAAGDFFALPPYVGGGAALQAISQAS
jgi:leucyl/phenylalanyl-tRNA--protein transferase